MSLFNVIVGRVMSRFAGLEEQRVYEKQRREKYKATHKAWRDKHKEELKLNTQACRRRKSAAGLDVRKEFTKLKPTRRNKRVDRRQVVNLWKEAGCFNCGATGHPAAFDAHHLDKQTKLFSIASYFFGKFSEEELKLELAKCVCLCAVCHRLVHAGVIELKSTSFDRKLDYSI